MTVTVTVYEPDGVTVRGTVPPDGLKWVDELGADGAASLTGPTALGVLESNPTLLDDGIGVVAVDGDLVFAFECKPPSGTLISDQERAGERASYTMPGLRHLLSYSPIWPSRNIAPRDAQGRTRVFGWQAASGSNGYRSADWHSAVVIDATAYGYTTRADWPDVAAQTISADSSFVDGQVTLYRKEFTLTAGKFIRILYTGDDFVSLWVDEVQVGESLTSQGDWARIFAYDSYYQPGTHTVALQAENVGLANWILVSGYELVPGAFGANLFHTDTSWESVKVSGSKPGWTAGGILLDIVEMAQSVNVYGLNHLAPDFTATHDSAGAVWPVLPERGYDIGSRTILDVVTDLEAGQCDVRVLPDGTLQAFKRQGADLSGSVSLVQGVKPENATSGQMPLLSYTYEPRDAYATRINVEARGGFVESFDATAEALYGRRYLGLTAPDTARADGTAVGDAELAVSAHRRFVYTAQFVVPGGGKPPFSPADVVSGLDRSRTVVPLRVLSLAGEVSEQIVKWTAELEEPL